MSLPHTILGMLDWKPFTGYDLKKRISRAEFLPWSGNSNQIYKSLLELARAGYVSCEVTHQDDGPTKKIYTITDSGRGELKCWLRAKPEAPEIRNLFLAQLSWGDLLDPAELDTLILAYEEEVQGQLLMAQEEMRRGTDTPRRTAREAFLWEMIAGNRVNALEAELLWVYRLRNGIPAARTAS